MDVTSVLFYAFSAILLFSAFKVVTSRNTVHATLYLMLAFFQASMVWMLMRAEFLAITLVLVYLGAVMVLFLFVVMMLDIDYADLREGFQRHLPIGLIVGGILLVELLVIFSGPGTTMGVAAIDTSRSNTALIGDVIYTDFIFLFQLAGLILLVAMIGAITLTMRHREGVKRQSIAQQNARTRDETITLISVENNVAPKSILPSQDNSKKVVR